MRVYAAPAYSPSPKVHGHHTHQALFDILDILGFPEGSTITAFKVTSY